MDALKNLETFLGNQYIRVNSKAAQWKYRVHSKFPTVLGLAPARPIIQLYREDSEFSTVLSFFNYISHFLPGEDITLDYKIRIFDRNGRLICSRIQEVRIRENAQYSLAAIAQCPLDEYGFVAISAKYRPANKESTAFLGKTSSQYMAFYLPKKAGMCPQILHSHIFIQKMPIPFRAPKVRRSSISEVLDGITRLQYYVLNSCPSPIRVHAELRDVKDDRTFHAQDLEIPGYGVRVFEKNFAPGEKSPQGASVVFAYDRLVEHNKPLTFRTFDSGIITATHT